MSAGAGVIDVQTGANVGVSVVDFSPQSLVDAVGSKTAIGQGPGGFPVIITPLPNVST